MRIKARAHRRAVESMAGLLAVARLDQVVGELFRNSRRAGATRIDVRTEGCTLRVTDDGCGIDDVDVLLHLGATGWYGAVDGEEPAGIGFFALGSVCGPDRPVRIASRPVPELGNVERRAALYPETFRGQQAAEVSRSSKGRLSGSGTAVEMSLEQAPKEWWLDQVARYSRVPVLINAKRVERVEYATEEAPERMLKWRNSSVGVHAAGRLRQHSGACLDGRVYRLPTITSDDDPLIRIELEPGDGLRPHNPGADTLAPGDALDDLKRFLTAETGARII